MGTHRAIGSRPLFIHQEDAGWIIYGPEIGTSKRIHYLLATKDLEAGTQGNV